MSDSDDTDQLLLIPPDFFLVRSSSSASSSDISLQFDQDQVGNNIVSDLITQVNDLEGRVCMIESFDRSGAPRSACLEYPLSNYSINSLTESDFIKGSIKTNQKIKYDQPLHGKHPFEITEDIKNQLIERGLSDSNAFKGNFMIHNSNQENINVSSDSNINSTDDKLENHQQSLIIKSSEQKDHYGKANQRGLFHEIDNFIESKKNQTLNSIYPSNVSETIEGDDVNFNSSEDQLDKYKHKSETYISRPNADSDFLPNRQSLTLPTVYQLLREMEETEREIENKLKCETEFDSEKTDLCKDNFKSSQTLTTEFGNIYSHLVTDREEGSQDQGYCSLNKLHRLGYSKRRGSHLYKLPADNETSTKRGSRITSPNSFQFEKNPADLQVPVSSNKNLKHVRSDKHNELADEVNFRPLLDTEVLKGIISSSSTYNGKLLDLQIQNSSNCATITDPDNFNGKSNYRTTHRNTLRKCGDNSDIFSTEKQKLSSNNLLSLSELWNKEPKYQSDDPKKLKQKLEEEKYRRQHCEQQIQALQLRVLEEQERLAVAINVDQEKDNAIRQITESWRKLNTHWGELEEQRHSLADQLQKEKDLSKVKTDELTKKVERWEKEVSQALDLAAGYKEKCESLQKQMDILVNNTQEKLKGANQEISCLGKENQKLLEDNEMLLNQLNVCRGRIEEEEQLLTKLKVELEKCKNECSELESEIQIIKEQKETLINKIKDEKGRNNMLEQQNKSLTQAVTELSEREKNALDEARASGERVKAAQTELRAYYQADLEKLLKEKLHDFESQLEAAESQLKAELRNKEKQWAEKANDQYRQLDEKHKIELYKKEESSKNEIEKWKVRLMESEKMRKVCDSKLAEETNRRAEIAHRLHSVMETQWREALNIISNPLLQNAYEANEVQKSKWSDGRSAERLQKGRGDMKDSPSSSVSAIAHAEEVPFYKEGLETCRTVLPNREQDLRKYIQMLLERGPGNPVQFNESLQENLDQTTSQESNVGSRYDTDDAKRSNETEKMGYITKPPWK